VVWVSPGNEGSQRKMGKMIKRRERGGGGKMSRRSMQQFLLRCVTAFPLFSFFSCTWGEYCRTTLKFLLKISPVSK